MERNGCEAREGGWMAGQDPAPLSLETIAVVEQLLVQMLGSLRRQAATSQAQAAGAAEYASWRLVAPRHAAAVVRPAPAASWKLS